MPAVPWHQVPVDRQGEGRAVVPELLLHEVQLAPFG